MAASQPIVGTAAISRYVQCSGRSEFPKGSDMGH